MHTTLRKIGNSWALIIPKPFLAHLGAKVGDDFDLFKYMSQA
jgi:antitoxin component of MazEF toxin-antitoxin module